MSKPRLLIVDDDEDIRTQMKWALASDYDVHMAGEPGRGAHGVFGEPSLGYFARSRFTAAPK